MTPEWLRSSSKGSGERQILREERPWRSDQEVPVHHRSSSDLNQSSVGFFLGWWWGGRRPRRNTLCVGSAFRKKIIKLFHIAKCKESGAELFVVLLVNTTSCSLSAVTSFVLISLQAAVHPPYRFTPEQTLAAICLSAEGCFCQFKNRSSVSQKMRWLQTPTAFVGFLFFSSMNASKNERESFQR